MEYTQLDGTDIEVSRIGLGTWAIGGWMWGGSDEAESIAAVQAAVDHGITLVDTAPIYGFGASESLVGRALSEGGRRERAVVATKVGLEWSDDHKRVRRNATRARIEREVEDSLRRLQTDRIDLYQVHWPDPATDAEETARAMEDLYRAGKIRAIGVSNFSPEQAAAFRAAAPLHASQQPWNLFERGIEADVVPESREHGTAILAYGALCRGLLSGHMQRDREFTGDDLRKADPKFRQPRFDQYLAAVDELERFAREHYQRGVRDLAVRWLLDQPGLTSALWGARRPAQLEGIDAVWDWQLDAAASREIGHIVERHVTDPVGPGFMAPPTP